MPITRGSGNPKWTWDETLIALDLLYRKGALDRRHPEVVGLSALLRAAELFPLEGRKDNFRNEDGVALKLQNLLSALDPSRGLSASSTDRAVVEAYPRWRADELALVADRIKAALKNPAAVEGGAKPEDDVEFVEGRILTAQHRSRDSRLRRRLLEQTSDEALTCEVCSFRAPIALERELRESFFETHHVLPLAASSGTRVTKLADLALLCAGCHRFLHKLMVRRQTWLTIEAARSLLKQS